MCDVLVDHDQSRRVCRHDKTVPELAQRADLALDTVEFGICRQLQSFTATIHGFLRNIEIQAERYRFRRRIAHPGRERERYARDRVRRIPGLRDSRLWF